MSLDIERFKSIFEDILKNHSNQSEVNDEDSAQTEGSYADELERLSEDREKLLTFRLKGRESFFIRKVRESVSRIEEGTFGLCEDCGGEIELGRLHARPTASLCICCKEEQERKEAQILYQKRSHTLGKTFGGNVIPLTLNDGQDDGPNQKAVRFNRERVVLGEESLS